MEMSGTSELCVQKEELQVQYTIIPAQASDSQSYVLKTLSGTNGFMSQTILGEDGFPLDPRLRSRRGQLPGLLPTPDCVDLNSTVKTSGRNGNKVVENKTKPDRSDGSPYEDSNTRSAKSVGKDLKESREPSSRERKDRHNAERRSYRDMEERGVVTIRRRLERRGSRSERDYSPSSRRRSRSPDNDTRAYSFTHRRRSRSRSRERRRRSWSRFDEELPSLRNKSIGYSAKEKMTLSDGCVVEFPTKRAPSSRPRTMKTPEPKKSSPSFFRNVDWEKVSLSRVDDTKAEQEVRDNVSQNTSSMTFLSIPLNHLQLHEKEVLSSAETKRSGGVLHEKKLVGKFAIDEPSSGENEELSCQIDSVAQRANQNENVGQKTLVDLAFAGRRRKFIAPMSKEKKVAPKVLKLRTADDQLEDVFTKSKDLRLDEMDLQDYVQLVDEYLFLTELDDFNSVFETFKQRYRKHLCYLEFFIHEHKEMSVWSQDQFKKQIGTLFIQFAQLKSSALSDNSSFDCGCKTIVPMEEMKSLKLLDEKDLDRILEVTFTECQAMVAGSCGGPAQPCHSGALKRHFHLVQGAPELFCAMHIKRISAHAMCPCGVFSQLHVLHKVEEGFARCPQDHLYHEACYMNCPHLPCAPGRDTVVRSRADR